MLRFTSRVWMILLLAIFIATPSHVAACTFCAGGLTSRLTLREHYHDAKAVLHGHLKNPKFDASGIGGTTELHLKTALKCDTPLPKDAVIIIPRYLPIIGDTPSEYLIFGTMINGTLDPIFGTATSVTVVEYLQEAAKLAKNDPVQRLGFYFKYVDHTEPLISTDAFLEIGKASDADILKAKAVFQPEKLRKLLQNANTPVDRLGVYALLLGQCGDASDAKFFADWVGSANPLPHRIATNLGGILAGWITLDPKPGWSATEAILTDGKRPFHERLAAVGTLRFFQSTRPESKAEVLKCYAAIIREGELADLAIDDLRRWNWRDLTSNILEHYNRNPAPPAIVRRAIIRYALTDTTQASKHFMAHIRTVDPKTVNDVEETLKLFGDK